MNSFGLVLLGGALGTMALAAAPPTPEAYFGHRMGADRELLDWSKVVGYFQALAKSSDRIRVDEFGRTAEGRPMIVATIAAPETLRRLNEYREIQRRLADPRLTSPSEAELLFRRGKSVVLITCSIHASEVGSTHTAVEYAWRLITGNTAHAEDILKNDIVLLAPSINPDGVDIVTQWYRKTLGTAWEGSGPPELWQKYVGHDNNRDWYIFSQPETRAVTSQLQNAWRPEITYDVHQQGPFGGRLFVPPWMDPIEPNVDAILAQEMNMMGTSIASDLTAGGFKGITIASTYDFWTPARAYAAFHGGLRMLTESASARLATPIDVDFAQLEEKLPGYNAKQRSWNFLEPWRGGRWTLRDIVDYQEAAFDSCLYEAAIHREQLLRGLYQVGRRVMAAEGPKAFLVSGQQRDPGATRRLLETLEFGDIEIHKAAGGGYVIPMNQPYAGWARALLERQNYPDLREYPGGPPRRPYDVTAHTLPLLFGVDVKPSSSLPELGERAEFKLFSPSPRAFSASDTDSWSTINQVWAAQKQVFQNKATGDFATEDRGSGWALVHRPRVALYRSWIPSMDEGWTRWLLERFGFAFTRVTNGDLQKGDLRGRFDVVIFPDQPAADLVHGYQKGSMPDQIIGGIGASGDAALKQFAEAGGTLIFLNRSTAYASEELGVRVKNVVEQLPETEFYSPGSLLYADVLPGSPLTFGLPEKIAIWSEQSPAWAVTGDAPVRYPEKELLASGWLLGEQALAGRAALLDVKMGRGHVLLFGMRPQYRAQSYQTFKLLFNALLYHP